VYYVTVNKKSECSEYGSKMNMPSCNGNNLAFRENKYTLVFKRLQRDIEYAIKLNFTVWSKITMLKKESSDGIATCLKEDESPQSMHSPGARSTRIYPVVSSPSQQDTNRTYLQLT
jgi:hypothetical protein